MAIFRSTADSANLLTHLGTTLGAIANGDEIQVESFAQDFTGGCDLSTKDLVRFRIGSGSSSRFLASLGSELVLVCNRTSTGVFVNETSADQIEVRSSSASGVIHFIENKPQNNANIMRLGACDCQLLTNLRGTVLANSDSDINGIQVLGGTVLSRAGAAVVVDANVDGGTFQIERDATTVTVSGAGVLIPNSTTFTPTTINLRGGGIIRVKETGNWGALNAYSGVIDLTGCKSLGSASGALFSVTSGVIFPGVTIRLRSGQTGIDISGVTSRGGGPKYEYV